MIKRPITHATFHTLKKHFILSLFLILSIIGSVVLSVIPPLVLKEIVASIVDDRNISIKLSLIYFAFIAFSGVVDALRSALITAFGQKTTAYLRIMMTKKLAKLPQSYYTHNESGKILSRFTGDIETIDTLFKNGVINIVVDLFKIIFILVAVFTQSLGLGVLLIGVTPIVFAVSLHFKRKMKSAQLENRRAVAKINNFIPETRDNIRTIRSLRKQEYAKNRFRKYVDESYSAFEKTYFYEAIYTPIINEISVLVISALMVFASIGGRAQAFFGMHVATAVALVSYVSKIFNPIENLGMEIQNIQGALAGINRVNEFFAEREKVEPTVNCLNQFDFSKNAIEFENVSFYYDEKAILKDVSFSVKPNSSVAFVGRTGSGKTTVYRLILGLFSPNEGSVKVFGVESDKINPNLYRQIFGYVEQNVKLIRGSLKDQITLGDNNVSLEQVISALDMVGLKEVCLSFKNGLEERVENFCFSQGQLQLLSIARAIVLKPKILLLDEITANLDSQTEKMVTKAIKMASENSTVLTISHRICDILQNTEIIDVSKLKNC